MKGRIPLKVNLQWMYTVRTKLTALTSLLITLIAMFVYWFFPARLEDQAMTAIADKANSIATMMAFNIAPAIAFDDRPMVCDVVISAKQNSDVEYIMVTDESSNQIASFDSVRAKETDYRKADFAEGISSDGMTFQTVAPIFSHAELQGRVYVGMSLKSLNEEIAKSRRIVAWVSLCIGAFGILFAIIVSAFITTPLIKIVDAVEKISRGDWKQRAKVTAGGELGNLAKAFNGMVENLESTYEELRKSEKNYRDLFASNPHPMWVHDLETLKLIEVNDSAVESYGYTRDEFLRMTIHDIIIESSTEKMEQLMTRQGNLYRSTGWRHLKKDGSVIDVEMSSHPLPLRRGRKARLVLASDITLRLRSEGLLRESEERYRDVIESASDLILTLDADWNFQFVNRAWVETLGYSESHVAKLQIFDIVKKEELARFKVVFRDVLNGKRFDHVQTVFISNDGREVAVEGSLSARFEDGKPVSTRGIFRDITERKRNEQAIKESEERYCVLSEATFEGISIVEKGLLVDLNLQYAKMLGYEREQLLGTRVFDLIHQDDHELVKQQIQHCPSEPYEHRLLRKDGATIFVEVHAQTFTNHGRTVRMSAVRDITERKLAEEALLFEKTRFEQLFENAPIGIVLADSSEKIVHANGMFQTMFGHSMQELTGNTINDILLPDDLRQEGNSYSNRVLNGEPVHGEAIRKRKDGSVIDVEFYGVPIMVNGKSAGLFGIYVDVSERKKAEREIRLLAHTVASTKDSVLISDLDERLIFVNDAFLKHYGYTRDEVIGHTVEMLRSSTTPHEIENRILPKTLEGGWYGEILNRKKDGTDFPIELWTSVVRNDIGEPVAMVGVVRDITERKRIEEALHNERVLLRTVIDNLPDAIYVKDTACRKTVANLADVRNVGLNSEAEVLGKDDFDVFPKELAEAFFADDQIVLRTGQPVLNREEYVVNQTGQPRWLLTSKLPLRDETGLICGLVGVGRDITAMKEVEDQRSRLMTELESINKELNDFAYIVSHDLKAPLRAIGSLVSWLTSDYGDKLGNEGNEMLQVLLGRTKRMHELIDGVLKYSRIGRARENNEAVALQTLIPEIIEMIDPPKHIEVKVDTSLPVVAGETTRLQQVFQNLLSNAIKFMDKPKGEVHIGCERENGNWKFSVADNGPGIEERHFKRIFQIFQTLSSRDEFESTGIGLTIVKKIVETYGGKIWLESKLGIGTTFYFTLPAAVAVCAEASQCEDSCNTADYSSRGNPREAKCNEQGGLIGNEV